MQPRKGARRAVEVICIFFGHHEALRFLLSRGADVHATDEYGSTPMHYACANQNAQALEMLRQAGASAVMSNVLGHTPRVLAAGAGFRPASLEIIHQMLTKVTQEELSMALHLSILFGSASAATVSALIRRGADLNARLSFPIFSTMGLLFRFMSWRQQCNRSAAGYYAAQHADATPLMCCILCGAFEAAAVLLASGARLDLKNRHGLMAQDLVRELGAPDFVVSAMQGRAQEAAIMECLAAELIST